MDSKEHTEFQTKSSVIKALSALLLVGFASTTIAQNVLEEVIVTAQKREQSLQDVGIAVSTFTGEQMRALGVEESIDLAAFTPGVHISGNLAGQNTQFTIRGVTQNDFNDIIEAPNAVYVDDGYIAIAQAQTFGVFDIERVEILKGPQGTLFGRNATGGLVHYITKKPSFDKVEGYADVTFGRFDSEADANQYTVEAAVGGPLSPQVAGRIAVMYDDTEAYLQNNYPFAEFGAASIGIGTSNSPDPAAGADLGGGENFAGRISLAFEPREDLSLWGSISWAHADVPTGPYQSKATTGVFQASTTSGLLHPDTGTRFELVNMIDTPAGDFRRSIGPNGQDLGSDQDDNGLFDDFINNATFAPVPDGLADVGRFPQPGTFTGGGDFFGFLDPDGDDFTNSCDFCLEDHGETETIGFNGHLEWDLRDNMKLTLVSDYKDYDKLLFIDVDSAPVNQLANYAFADATSFAQEVRVNGENDHSRWVLGFYYLNIDTDSDNGLKVVANGVAAQGPVGVDLGVDSQLETNSVSIFGQIETDLWENWTLIAGLRAISEEKDFSVTGNTYLTSSARTIHQGTPVAVSRPTVTFDTSDTLWTGKLQLDWHVDDDLLIYGGINRGVKAGSFNAPIQPPIAIPNSAIPYDEEVLVSYEGGFKKSLFGGHTRINGSIFYYDYSDYQAFLFAGVGGVVINADAENKGVELDIQTSPIEGLDAMFALSWFDATVENVPLSIGSSIRKDVDPTYAPEFQFSGLVRYEWPALNGNMSIQGDFSYSDEYFYNLRNFDASNFDSYWVGNARLGWTSQDGRWDAAFMVTNITDERIGIQGFDIATACGCNEISFRPPRWYGFNLRYSF